jgi:hypothetical protein
MKYPASIGGSVSLNLGTKIEVTKNPAIAIIPNIKLSPMRESVVRTGRIRVQIPPNITRGIKRKAGIRRNVGILRSFGSE